MADTCPPRNIIISGVPRAGKTTLSRMLIHQGFSHISMDAIIAGFEQCYPETGISTYQGLSSADTLHLISGKIAPFMRAMINGQYSGYDGGRAVIDVYQLLPEDFIKHFSGVNCSAIWLGSSDCDIGERLSALKVNDTTKDYTFYKTEAELREGCGYIVEQSQLFKRQCEKFGLPFYDTTYDRERVFEKIVAEIADN